MKEKRTGLDFKKITEKIFKNFLYSCLDRIHHFHFRWKCSWHNMAMMEDFESISHIVLISSQRLFRWQSPFVLCKSMASSFPICIICCYCHIIMCIVEVIRYTVCITNINYLPILLLIMHLFDVIAVFNYNGKLLMNKLIYEYNTSFLLIDFCVH